VFDPQKPQNCELGPTPIKEHNFFFFDPGGRFHRLLLASTCLHIDTIFTPSKTKPKAVPGRPAAAEGWSIIIRDQGSSTLLPFKRRDADNQPKSYLQITRSLQKKSRAPTFDPGSKMPPAMTTAANATRDRFRGIVKNTPVVNRNPYKHEAIEYEIEIRILRILPGAGDDNLECVLFPSKWYPEKDRSDRYCALSYWWGDENEVANNKITIFHE
jgi:hypothetical protein